jgi:hypothetical protein
VALASHYIDVLRDILLWCGQEADSDVSQAVLGMEPVMHGTSITPPSLFPGYVDAQFFPPEQRVLYEEGTRSRVGRGGFALVERYVSPQNFWSVPFGQKCACLVDGRGT